MNITSRIRLMMMALIIISCLSSCVSKKKVLYFQGIEDLPEEVITESYTSKIQPSDMLQIRVSALDNEAVQPFNMGTGNNGSSGGGNNGGGSRQANTFLVDEDGYIDYPYLGALKVSGMTRKELTAVLKEKISEYVVDPVVVVLVQNHEVMILGEVAHPGPVSIDAERLTIVQALGKAGDLTINSKRQNILVIREEDGVKKYFRVDVTKAEFMNSPGYYLKRNDIVYVEPNNFKIQTPFRGSFGFFTAVTSFVIGLIALLTR
ncbi:polysaccharide biosynthesis/export family protein [Robertkochia solimangrovi]|uniref:polysaccharide biosynthesis/export family protein n=1 Tax=Robertkochia solimangrovi TaxID=2213046 RepID=UPI00117E9E91|nr:polysaccharide biosynthesis/export family protein [Robertkochia solimangrovi]TRZ44963.1 polysaccharide export protein [Robertkochia solimangrovi]